MSELIVTVREVYGRPLIYPVNEQAKRVCTMLMRKTLEEKHVAQLRELGFTVQYKAYFELAETLKSE